MGLAKTAEGALQPDHQSGWRIRPHVKRAVNARQLNGAKSRVDEGAASGGHDAGCSRRAAPALRSVFLVLNGHAVVAACDWSSGTFGVVGITSLTQIKACRCR